MLEAKANGNNESKLLWDNQSNTIHLIKKEEEKQKLKLRGFILHVADSEEEATAYREGRLDKLNISPVYSTDEQSAINYVQGQGKIVLSIVTLELLELQLKLLNDVAIQQNIEIDRKDLFKINS